MKIPKLVDLPLCMAERALLARRCAAAKPDEVQMDSEFMPWAYDYNSDIWYCFDGRYSKTSPVEKIERQREYDDRWREFSEKAAIEYGRLVFYQSDIRQKVLDRDDYTCQLCFAKGNSRFHVHHIMKRSEGGTDHLDNLVVVCPKCHRLADTKLYNPEWVKREGEQ